MSSGSGGGGGGGGLFSGLLGRAARSMVEHALNSTVSAASGSGGNNTTISVTRSFFDLGGSGSGSGAGSDFMDDSSDNGAPQIVEYAGRSANDDVTQIKN